MTKKLKYYKEEYLKLTLVFHGFLIMFSLIVPFSVVFIFIYNFIGHELSPLIFSCVWVGIGFSVMFFVCALLFIFSVKNYQKTEELKTKNV